MKFTDCIEIVGSKPTLYEGTKQYVSTGAVEEYFINEKSIEEYSYKERPSRADLVGKSGDILFAKMAETKKTLILDKETENYLFSTGFFAIRPKNGILTTKCLYYLLNSKNFLNQKDKNSSGATQKAITNAGLEKINVNIPLFFKQDQIVKQFDLLTDIIKKYQSQLKKLDSLIKSRFIEMFGDNPVENGKWKVEKLGNLVTVTSSKRIYAEEQSTEGIPFLRISDLVSKINGIDSNDLYIPEEKYHEFVKNGLVPNVDDILVTSRGTLGLCYTITADDKFYFQDGMITWLKFSNHESILSIFLSFLFNVILKQKIDLKTNGATVKYVSISELKNLEIPVPPLELQQQFAAFVQQIDKSKFEIWRYLKFSDIMKRIGFILYD